MLAFLLWLLATLTGGAPVADDAGAQTLGAAGASSEQVGTDPPDDPIKRCIKCTVN
ncbi:MAG TPA: hypothetical protein VIG88_06905 [Lysobacter sp.]